MKHDLNKPHSSRVKQWHTHGLTLLFAFALTGCAYVETPEGATTLNLKGQESAWTGYWFDGEMMGRTRVENAQAGAMQAAWIPYIARFVGMAPALHPKLVVAVMVEEPQGKLYQGGDVAAPAFAKIMAGSLKRVEGLDTLPVRQAQATASTPLLQVKHSGCYGPCPEYEITLSSNGEVQYRGGAYPTGALAGLSVLPIRSSRRGRPTTA